MAQNFGCVLLNNPECYFAFNVCEQGRTHSYSTCVWVVCLTRQANNFPLKIAKSFSAQLERLMSEFPIQFCFLWYLFFFIFQNQPTLFPSLVFSSFSFISLLDGIDCLSLFPATLISLISPGNLSYAYICLVILAFVTYLLSFKPPTCHSAAAESHHQVISIDSWRKSKNKQTNKKSYFTWLLRPHLILSTWL